MHLVPRLARRVPAVAAALCALTMLAGCGSDALAKKPPFPRSTVQAAKGMTDPSTDPGSGSTGSGKPVDPAFAVDKLRLVDPCKLLDADTLKELGKPDEAVPGGFTRCSNFMKDKAGKDLSITIEVGQTLTSEVEKADKKLAGLNSYEQVLEGSACFVTVITQEDPGIGITVQVGYKDGDGCEPGRKIAESVVKLAKGKAVARTAAKGSLITLDPCELPSDAAVADAAKESPRVYPYGLHNCSWVGSDAEVTLDFRGGYVPKDDKFDPKQVDVDLGGVKAYQVESSTSYPSCTLRWVQLKGQDNDGEVVEVKSAGPKKSEFDRCAKAQAFAKALLPKIPKA
ncbi:uncharacterized protein DUF3558 [Umezawaea tangerina]|uniref:Uncharacterized protein DUF3558 n=1 Tax=Umezawaea tangerina TaxID=84725 RepID=A0A2T0SLR7_9PSEU|nr:uncharacterized protein DUF3558 [Umezawaea tangerina]